MRESQKKSLLKGISWRLVGTIDTLAIAFVISNNPEKSIYIAITEVFTKVILYYFHERMYVRTLGDRMYERKFSLLKGVTWRILGSIDTVLISWAITGSSKMGLKIGVAELITKYIFYYIHERIWSRIQIKN